MTDAPYPSLARETLPSASSQPSLVLNEEGTILAISATAGLLLECNIQQFIHTCFFSLLHGKSIHWVMRDVAQMVAGKRDAAHWLLWLRKGNGKWAWFSTKAHNRLQEESSIHLFLQMV